METSNARKIIDYKIRTRVISATNAISIPIFLSSYDYIKDDVSDKLSVNISQNVKNAIRNTYIRRC
jgi:hypothetical protein